MIDDDQVRNAQPELHLVDEFPNPLMLSRESESDYYNGKLALTNKTLNYVIFKVYFSQKTIFSASPSLFFIQPLEAIDINVKCFERSFVTNSPPVKMLIAVYQMEKVINTKEEVKEIFEEKKRRDKTASQEITVLVKVDANLKPVDRNAMSHNESEAFGNEDVGCDDLPVEVGIDRMQKINEGYKEQIGAKQKAIEIMESQLNNLGRNKQLFESKTKALTKTETGDGKKKSSFSNLLLLMCLIFSLVLGGMLARVKHSLI